MVSSVSAGSFGGNDKGGEGSFASEFEALFGEKLDNIKPGKIVSGVVTAVAKEMVSVDIGFKSEGVVPTEQFQNAEGKIIVSVGEEVRVLILRE